MSASFYPSMMSQFGIFPCSLGDAGLEEFREILAERLEIKERSAAESNPAISKRLKIQADGLKIVLNSTFGQSATRTPCSTTTRPSSL